MEILLRRDVDNLGAAGEVVRVREGYARNFLFPRGLGCVVTTENRRRVVVEGEKRVKLAAERAAQAKQLARKLEGYSLTIESRATKDGTLYGSVGPAEIVAAPKRDGITAPAEAIRLAEPVKQVGVFDVPVQFTAEAVAHLRLWVVEQKGGR